MNDKRESLLLAGICAAVLLLSGAAIVWTFYAGMYRDIDGLLLLVIALTIGGIFQIMLFLIAKSQGWLDNLPIIGKKKPAGSASEAARPPAEESK